MSKLKPEYRDAYVGVFAALKALIDQAHRNGETEIPVERIEAFIAMLVQEMEEL